MKVEILTIIELCKLVLKEKCIKSWQTVKTQELDTLCRVYIDQWSLISACARDNRLPSNSGNWLCKNDDSLLQFANCEHSKSQPLIVVTKVKIVLCIFFTIISLLPAQLTLSDSVPFYASTELFVQQLSYLHWVLIGTIPRGLNGHQNLLCWWYARWKRDQVDAQILSTQAW